MLLINRSQVLDNALRADSQSHCFERERAVLLDGDRAALEILERLNRGLLPHRLERQERGAECDHCADQRLPVLQQLVRAVLCPSFTSVPAIPSQLAKTTISIKATSRGMPR
jgi:hypothetical protein